MDAKTAKTCGDCSKVGSRECPEAKPKQPEVQSDQPVSTPEVVDPEGFQRSLKPIKVRTTSVKQTNHFHVLDQLIIE